MPGTVRAASSADAGAITDVQVAAWRTGYAHVFGDDVLYADDFDASRREFWTAWRFAPGERVAVACDPNGLVSAFCSYGPERDRGRTTSGRGEINAFYAHPDVWGDGTAALLMRHVDARLRSEGFAAAVLWVLDDNPRARAFYARHGWEPSGLTAEIEVRGTVAAEVEYRTEFG